MGEGFMKAAEAMNNLKTKPTDNELYEVYGLYKQATVGDVNIDSPGLFDLQGKAKWEAWNGRKGLAREDAEKQYVAVVNSLIQSYGLR